MKTILSLAILIFPALASAQFSGSQRWDGSWVVRKTEWSASDERAFENFVQALGRTKCNTVDGCIRHPANPYRDTDPQDVKFFSDCADFPYFLRAYFAWKNDLPFGYVSQVRSYDKLQPQTPPKPGEEQKPFDIRYSQLGNYPAARRTLVPRDGQTLDFFREMSTLQNTISSATLRIGPEVQTKIASDFYSPDLRPGSIRPGTVIYDPAGHVAVVYEVLPDGRVLHFDAHPDNTVTRGIFSAKFSRSHPSKGAGFKNFRPFRLEGARRSWWGSEYTGGQLVFARNEEISDYSLTQYLGVNPVAPNADDWKKGLFRRFDRNVTYHEYVRMVLATQKINPVDEFTLSLEELCDDLKERVTAVQVAVTKGIHKQAHPATLPGNLFGSAGDWETYSTPGRDARLRDTFLEIQKEVGIRYNEWLRDDYRDMQYNGDDLKKDLLRAFHKVNLSCQVGYKNSAGRTVQLGFEISVKRLFAMSFDPYHCPELRWGASHPDELRTCADDADKYAWYSAQQTVRNSTSRDWSSPTDLTIDVLASGRYGSKIAPDVDLRQYLQNLPSKGAR